VVAESQPFRTAAGTAAPRHRGSLIRTILSGLDRWVVLTSLIYVAAAIGIVGVLHLPSAEAVARTAHLGTLFGGYDPLPLAFGIERPPLLSVLALPAAAFEPLRDHALAAALGTAMTGGLSVVAARRLVRWAGFGPVSGFVATAAFALHPLLIFSGAVGLPEALYATLLLFGLGQFARWVDQDSTGAVIGAGAAFGLAFLLRYNVVFVAIPVGLGFWYLGTLRGGAYERQDRGQAAALAFAVPTIFTAGLFGLITWFAHGNLNEFLMQASRLSALAANDGEVAERMGDLQGDLAASVRWVGLWSLALGAASWAGIAALAAHAALRRRLESAVLAAVLVCVLLPELVALFSGQGQPHVTHLIPFAVAGFVAVAYLMRLSTGGRPPNEYDRRGRRVQLAAAGALLLGSAVSVIALPRFPDYDQPAPNLLQRVVEGNAATPPADVLATVEWIRDNVPPGGLLADTERHAEVMVALNDFTRFSTEGDDDAEATLFDPVSRARFILIREPIAGAGPGRIERAHRSIYEDGTAFTTPVFEAGHVRIHRVDGPALR